MARIIKRIQVCTFQEAIKANCEDLGEVIIRYNSEYKEYSVTPSWYKDGTYFTDYKPDAYASAQAIVNGVRNTYGLKSISF